MKANELRAGRALRLDGKLFIATQVMHRTPGNLRAFVQTKLRDIRSGALIEKRFASTEEVEDVSLDRRDMEYLYRDGDDAVFMDDETFEQFTLGGDLLGDCLLYIKPNEHIKGLFHESACLSIELPGTVDLVITETEPGVKHATATNVLKPATCETGLTVKVPPFISAGETVRINTETGEYLGRVNE